MNKLMMKFDLDTMITTNDNGNLVINLSKYNIDVIHNVLGKTQIFEKDIKFIYLKESKELILLGQATSLLQYDRLKFITITFYSTLEERELKLNQLGI